ncbi:MAG: transporter substrate-binding domain-containing protein [Oleiphilaceae bacterium]|nr:transporter substrate-binding domain-containing protein [Oleiphilaceae bacterium]
MPYRVFTLFLLLLMSATTWCEEIHIATGEYPPWASADLAHDGITNRVVREAFAHEDIKVVYHYMPWSRALEATRVGKYLATSFWSHAKERVSDFLHSDPITDLPLMLFHKRSTHVKRWDKLEDLAYLRFGATRGYTYTDEFWDLARHGVLRVSTSNSDIDNFKKLLADQIDIFPISLYTGWYTLATNFSADQMQRIQTQATPLRSTKEYLLFSRQHPKAEYYLRKFNAGLAKILEDGAVTRYSEELLRACCEFVIDAPPQRTKH